MTHPCAARLFASHFDGRHAVRGILSVFLKSGLVTNLFVYIILAMRNLPQLWNSLKGGMTTNSSLMGNGVMTPARLVLLVLWYHKL